MEQRHSRFYVVARATETAPTQRLLLAAAFAAALTSLTAATPGAQYLYLDTNGDGFSTTADRVNPAGTTTLDVWVRTNANRDGTAGLCLSDDGELTIRSYEIILHARGGTVAWLAFTNRVESFAAGAGAVSDTIDYRNGFAGEGPLPPGSYRLATIEIETISGAPSIEIASSTPLGPAYRTAFGSECSGADFDGLLKLGSDFHDADGAPWGGHVSSPVALAQPGNMAVVEGETADQALSATDLDGLPLDFTLESGPAFVSVATTTPGAGEGTGSVHLAPGYSDAGISIVAVRAGDGVASDTKTFLVTVQNGDRAPSLAQPPDIMVTEGMVKGEYLAATDPDQDPVTFLKVAGPDYMTVLTLDPNLAQGFVQLAPGFGDAGTTTGEVGATDGVLTDTKPFMIMVREQDRPPALSLPADPSVGEGDLLRFTVTGTDPDGDMVTLSASGVPEGAVFRDGGYGAGEFLWVPGFAQAGLYAVDFTATGMPGVASTGRVSITVTEATGAVMLAQPLDMVLPAGTTADQVLRAIDQSGDPLAFAAVSGPTYMSVTTVETGTGEAAGLVRLTPAVSEAGEALAVVAATDGVDRDERSFAIRVLSAGGGEDDPPFSTPLASIETGLTPHTVTFADVDRDGHLDLLTSNLGSNSIFVRRGRGDGTFLAAESYTTLSKPHTVLVSDLNGDGRPDLGVSQMGANSLAVLPGLGDGTFGARVDIPIAGSPMFLGIADLNGDAAPDLIATNQSAGTVAVLLGKGDATFLPPVEYPTGALCHGLALADFNGDGAPDVIAANPGPGTVSILLGSRDGTLSPKSDFMTSSPHTVGCGDLDGDGLQDAVIANFDAGTISVMFGRGDGSFDRGPDVATGAGAHAAIIRDLDGDGRADIAAANQTSNTVSFFMGRGGRSFGPRVDFSDGAGAHSLAAGDLNEDGALDLAVSNIVSNTVTLFLNRRPPPVRPARAFTADRSRVISLRGPDKPDLFVRLEPVDGAYENADVVPGSIALTCENAAVPEAILATAGKAGRVADQDRNGILELGLSFAHDALRRVLGALDPGPHEITARIDGRLVSGARLRATLLFRVVAPGGYPIVRVSPNPLNPDAILSFTTFRPGFARVRIYDLGGRLVRSLIDEPDLPAGRHAVRIAAGSDDSGRLASGVYFYRVETLEGVSSGRFAVLK